jgi:arylsulfatase A-like enzyme
VGRQNTVDLIYPELPSEFRDMGEAGQFLSACYRLDYDMGKFFEALKEAGLWDEETLIILTSDHACPLNPIVGSMKGYKRDTLARIPLAFLTPQKLPEIPLDTPACQLDLAPTLAHLLDLPPSTGWWGESLYAPNRKGTRVGYSEGSLYFKTARESFVVALSSPRNESERRIVDLFNTLVIDPR